MVNPQLLKLAIEVLKELPAGAVYSSTQAPPEGVKEETAPSGTKYWIPQKDKEKTTKPTTTAKPEKATLVRSKNKLSDYFSEYEIDLYMDDLYVVNIARDSQDNVKGDVAISEKDGSYFITALYLMDDGEAMDRQQSMVFDSIEDAKIAITRLNKIGYHSTTNEQRDALYERIKDIDIEADFTSGESTNYPTLFTKQRKISTVILQDIKSNSFDREKYMEALSKIMLSTIKRSDQWKEEAEDRKELEETGVTGYGQSEDEYYARYEQEAKDAANAFIDNFLGEIYIDELHQDALINPKYDKGFTLTGERIPFKPESI